jgi:uncharacterized alkaline shock family protein YloU
MSDRTREKVAITTNVLQTIVMCIAIGAVMLEMGRKDNMLDSTVSAVSELRGITTDLAKTQVDLSINTEYLRERVEALHGRLATLENRR